MSNEELLKPRYKVIADYPLSPVKIGDIFYSYGNNVMQLEKKGFTNIRDLEQYPHLFKKLEWWEDRKASEMPKYVRNKTSKPISIIKIDSWHLNTIGEYWANYDNKSHFMNMWALTPATKEEYENQVKEDKKQQ